MKTLRVSSLLIISLALANLTFSQKTITETIPVSGNCGMCKTAIEKAAKKAGASAATWNMETKTLAVTYSSSATNAAKIQESIAAVGYDTRDFKASDESYNKLHACCQYDRKATKQTAHQCSEKCDMKDGKCADMTACKEKGCCKDSATGKMMSCCTKDDSSAGEKMDCCKNGKM